MLDYDNFVNTKRKLDVSSGHEPGMLNEYLFDFQHAIVKWAIRKGRAAIFADTGLGKTLMQLSWADEVATKTKKPVLIFAPLAVSEQTIKEGEVFGITVNRLINGNLVDNGIHIINYERMDSIDFDLFSGIVLDESSILKSHDGKTRNKLIDCVSSIPYRLSCTATPSPNDFEELGNQTEFLGIMSRKEMLATYFVNDTFDTGTWRLKGWGASKFWEFMASWSVVISNPSDIGYDGSKYNLHLVKYIEHVVDSDIFDGELFVKTASTLQERRRAQRNTLENRCRALSEVVNSETNEPWIVWCHLNDEADLLSSLIPGSVNVRGSDSQKFKTDTMMNFTNGKLRVLISKPSICGWGMNWQHCARMAFVGLDDSFEKFYQAVRRCHRFGQKRQVEVHIFTSESEGQILNNIKRKESQHIEMSKNMIGFMGKLMKDNINGTEAVKDEYEENTINRDEYTLYLGDCVKWTSRMEDNSIDYSIFSPPFADLFTFSNSNYDMGNCIDDVEFFNHMKFLVKELYRVVKSGRNVSFHCMNLPTRKSVEGYIGLRDFRGDFIRLFQEAGFIYHSEVCIWKDPVVAMQRTKALGLLHKTVKENSTMARVGLADYVVTMRKPGECEHRVKHDPNDLPVSLWAKYASPIWDDINQSRTLNKLPARSENDEKHMAPLQLDVIERCIHLWSNKGDIVFSPFAGIGSEGYCALKMNRKFVGIELKKEYFNLAIQNISSVASEASQESLFG